MQLQDGKRSLSACTVFVLAATATHGGSAELGFRITLRWPGRDWSMESLGLGSFSGVSAKLWWLSSKNTLQDTLCTKPSVCNRQLLVPMTNPLTKFSLWHHQWDVSRKTFHATDLKQILWLGLSRYYIFTSGTMRIFQTWISADTDSNLISTLPDKELK